MSSDLSADGCGSGDEARGEGCNFAIRLLGVCRASGSRGGRHSRILRWWPGLGWAPECWAGLIMAVVHGALLRCRWRGRVDARVVVF